MSTTETRVVCDKCGQEQGGFHKRCDGRWVRQKRTVTDWRTVGRPLNLYTPARFESACGDAFYEEEHMLAHAMLCDACQAADDAS